MKPIVCCTLKSTVGFLSSFTPAFPKVKINELLPLHCYMTALLVVAFAQRNL